jgi:hypothetical protein
MIRLRYEQAGHVGRTVIVRVMSDATVVGTIRWYAPRQCYVFYPMSGTLFDTACLQSISSQMSELQAAWASRGER